MNFVPTASACDPFLASLSVPSLRLETLCSLMHCRVMWLLVHSSISDL